MILFALHSHAALHSRHDCLRDDINVYDDAVTLAHGLVDALSEPVLLSLTARDLKLEVQKRKSGIVLNTDNLPLSRLANWYPAVSESCRHGFARFMSWCSLRYAEFPRSWAAFRTAVWSWSLRRKYRFPNPESQSWEELADR